MWRIYRPDALDVLEDEGIIKALSGYFEVMLNKKLSKFKVASMIKAEESNDIESLWDEHKRIQEEFSDTYDRMSKMERGRADFSYLDLKIKIADKIFEDCHLCERRCYVNRNVSRGFCRVGKARIASEFIHIGEEAPLVPSHTIFFTGCTFKCVYCQNWDISQYPESGMKWSEEKLARTIDIRRQEGSRNVNFVGGEPTPNTPYILRTMSLCRENIPVVWNSNFYMSTETMDLLDGFVDLFLTDFKYGNGGCAGRLSSVENYWEIVTRNHILASSSDMLIRHLVLPNHIECCTKPILEWISQNLGEETVINIMGQYRPTYMAEEYEEIARFPYPHEMEEAISYAKGLGFINIIS